MRRLVRAGRFAAYGAALALAAGCGIDAVGAALGDAPPTAAPADASPPPLLDASSGVDASAAPPPAPPPPPDDAGADVEVDAGDGGVVVVPDPPAILSPWTAGGSLTYQRAIDWTIASLDPAATLHYTTDGSTPTTASPSATGAVTLPGVLDGTRIQWIAGPSSPAQSFVVHVDPGLQGSLHGMVDRVAFDASGTPFAKVAPSSTVTGHARYRVWAQSSCPGCIVQIAIGFTTVSSCIYDEQPGTFPGETAGNQSFQLTAPATPGTYPVKMAVVEFYECGAGTNDKPGALGTPLGNTVIGTLVVE